MNRGFEAHDTKSSPRTMIYVLSISLVCGILLGLFGLVAIPLMLASHPLRTLQVKPGELLVFAVVGDSRSNPDMYQQLLDRVVENGNMFLINTGDLVQRGNLWNFAAFHKSMVDFPLPFYPVPGNHDRSITRSLTNFLIFSGAPAPHYSFDMGTAHFTIANSSSGRLHQSELNWIDQDLSATDRPIKFVFMHHPPFDPDGSDHILATGNDAFMALMKKHRVDHVFTGNIHAYSLAVRNGTTYIITGGGGAPLYHKGHPNAFYHYVQVTVDGYHVRTRVVRMVP